MVSRVKLGTVPVGPGRRFLEVLRCQDEGDHWVEVHDDPAGDEYMSSDTFLLTASEARALAALLTQAAEGPGIQPFSQSDLSRYS